MMQRLAVGPQGGGDRGPDGAGKGTGEVRQARRRRQPLRRQAGEGDGGQRHEEAGHREALDKLWPRRGAKVHPRFEGPGAPVEADRVHNKAEGDQPPHVELMREAADNRRQNDRDHPHRRRRQAGPGRGVAVDLLQQLRQQYDGAEVEHIGQTDTEAADGEVARLK